MKQHYIRLETAKLLKEIGFHEWCNGIVTEYLIDQIDPSYPEGGGPFSMTKGEIEFSDDYSNNNYLGDFGGDHFVSYSCPRLYDVQRYIRESHKYHVSPFFENNKWKCRIQYLDNDLPTRVVNDIFDDYESALGEGIKETLEIIKSEIKRHEQNIKNID